MAAPGAVGSKIHQIIQHAKTLFVNGAGGQQHSVKDPGFAGDLEKLRRLVCYT